MKILHLDIETAPNVVHVWGLWNQNVSIKQVQNSSYTLCWAAKWDGAADVMFSSIHATTHRKMLKQAHSLIGEADAVVHYNGSRFDIPTLNWEFVKFGLPPPAPHINIDLYSACKKKFKMPSFKLDFVVRELGIGAKLHHKGHQLWIDCMGGRGVTKMAHEEAWQVMEEYNRQDVVLNELVYHKLMGWIGGHPNHNLYNDDAVTVCVNCGGTRIHRKAMHYTRASMYKRYRCADCGKWMRGRKMQLSDEVKQSMLVAAI